MSPLEYDYKLHMIGKTDAEWVSLNEILSSERFVTEQITTSLDRQKRLRKMSTDSGKQRISLLADNNDDSGLSDDSLIDGDEDVGSGTLFLKEEEKRGNIFKRLVKDSWLFKSIRESVKAIKQSLTDGLLYYED